MARIAVVVPSIGRPTLARTVQSAQWADEVLVVYDGPDADAREDLPKGTRVMFHPAFEPSCDWGMTQRNHALKLLASGKWNVTHVSFMDDDDVYAPAAGEVIRAAVEAQPGAAHIFCMQRRGGEIIGRHRKVEGGMVGTPMIVVPVGRHGVWGARHEGDLDFCLTTAEVCEIVWHDDVIALIDGWDA